MVSMHTEEKTGLSDAGLLLHNAGAYLKESPAHLGESWLSFWQGKLVVKRAGV